VVLCSIPLATVIGAKISHQVTEWQPFVGVMQAIIGAAIGLVAVYFTSLPLWIAIVSTIASQTINLIAKSIKVWKNRQRTKALNGEYGEVTKWATELTKEGDMAFATAIQSLPKEEKIEISIIVESKEELRELTMERFEELADDVPEDFA